MHVSAYEGNHRALAVPVTSISVKILKKKLFLTSAHQNDLKIKKIII
jgi:hypothetical protein